MGITVFSLLHEHKEELNEMRKIDLLLQIASGMCYLHCKYIVHLRCFIHFLTNFVFRNHRTF
jgi:hypothetical protein